MRQACTSIVIAWYGNCTKVDDFVVQFVYFVFVKGSEKDIPSGMISQSGVQ